MRGSRPAGMLREARGHLAETSEVFMDFGSLGMEVLVGGKIRIFFFDDKRHVGNFIRLNQPRTASALWYICFYRVNNHNYSELPQAS